MLTHIQVQLFLAESDKLICVQYADLMQCIKNRLTTDSILDTRGPVFFPDSVTFFSFFHISHKQESVDA